MHIQRVLAVYISIITIHNFYIQYKKCVNIIKEVVPLFLVIVLIGVSLTVSSYTIPSLANSNKVLDNIEKLAY